MQSSRFISDQIKLELLEENTTISVVYWLRSRYLHVCKPFGKKENTNNFKTFRKLKAWH